MSKAAYLRTYVVEDRVNGYLEHDRNDRAARPRVLIRDDFGVRHESLRDDAFVVERRGVRYVCPRYPRLRMLEGLIAFRNSYPGPTASMLVPQQMAERAADELDRIQGAEQPMRSHILTSPFHVPLRWFAAFDPSEREVHDGRGGPVVRYWTTRRQALARLTRTVEILDAAGFEDTIVDQVGDLAAWVRAFPSPGLLELDYGGVSRLFSAADLALDESAAEVAASLDALEEGDFDASSEHYARVAERWAHAQSLTYAN
jgi:hypothetical protein